MINFYEFGLSQSMIDALKAKGFDKPSPIQALVIPEFLREHANILGQAQTGTGKTAAFAIPILETIKPKGRVQALVLAPTRELALQVGEEMMSLVGSTAIKICAVYGGASIEQQVRNVKRGADIVVGTPGRVMDLMRRGVLDFSNLEFFVLDEADEMLNMGFVDDIEDILKKTNDDKNMLLFSATMPSSILQIAKKYMGKFKTLKVENQAQTTAAIKQVYFDVRESDKFNTLCRVMDYEQGFYGIVFCRTKAETDEVVRRLKIEGHKADALHGDVTQSQRTKTLAEFKEKIVTVLVATDVAARGIDVNNLTHVVNYTLPQEVESYVHRIGRTGRAGNKGVAISFVTAKERSKISLIMRVAKADIQKQLVPTTKDIIKAKEGFLINSVGDLILEGAHLDYLELANKLLAHKEADQVIAALLRHQYKSEFLVENYPEISEVKMSSFATGGQARLFIALGKKDGLGPKSLIDLLAKRCKTHPHKVQNVKVMDAFSFVNVPQAEADFIMRSLNVDGRKIVELAKS